MKSIRSLSGVNRSLLRFSRSLHPVVIVFGVRALLLSLGTLTPTLTRALTSVVQEGVACGKIEGADPPALAKRVQELANERVAEKGKGEKVGGVEPALQAKLKKIIRCESREAVCVSLWQRCMVNSLALHVAREVICFMRMWRKLGASSCLIDRPNQPLQAHILQSCF